ncbi:MAG: GAF domain-containing protein [Elainellaceae cyanobacterium]
MSAIKLQPVSSNLSALIPQAFKERFQNHRSLLRALLTWTGGQPLLTRRLCELLLKAPDVPPPGSEADWVEEFVRYRVVLVWDTSSELEFIRDIRDYLVRPRPSHIKLLKLYRTLIHRGELTYTASHEQQELQRLELAQQQGEMLEVHNRIYATIFNADWVDGVLKKLHSGLASNEAEFRKLLLQLERKLLLSQVRILSSIDDDADDQASARILYETLRDVAAKVGALLSADRVSIFLVNQERTELCSLVAENDRGEFLDIQLQMGEGIAGRVAETKAPIHIPNNIYDDPRADRVKVYDQTYGYRTHNILALPILNREKQVVAVIQLLNKLQTAYSSTATAAPKGFTRLDLERLSKCLVPIRRILESCQSCYAVIKKLRATAALVEATSSIDQISLDTKAILQRVMDSAKKLMNADRSTLWLVDRDRGDLWTEIPGKGEVRCAMGIGFAGTVAQTREPINIPYDLYNHPSAGNAKHTDKQTRYRTCSLLCMPIISPDNDLIGVTQLVNKCKPGDHPPYRKTDWPRVPDHFKTSFDKNDQQAMQVFNQRVGVILQFVKSHETLKYISQAKPKEAIYNALAVLSNAVTDQSEEALYNALYNMLNFISQSISKLLRAAHTTVFLLDLEGDDLWSLNLEEGDLNASEFRISSTLGIARKVSESKAVQVAQQPYRFRDPLICKGVSIKQLHRFQSLALFPIVDHQGQIIGVVRSFDKLDPNFDLQVTRTANAAGFSQSDAALLQQSTENLLPVLQAFRSFHREILTIQEQRRELDPLYRAISFVSQSSGNAEELIQNVMKALKTLTNADRTSLWLLNPQTQELWTKIQQSDQSWLETKIPIGEGFVGLVAQTRQGVNIPFDLYDHPQSAMARETDAKTHYRTCSLLCLPILSTDDELLGVTQLLNKRQPNASAVYRAENWPQAPEMFRASFDNKDRNNMEIFNNQVGVILPEIIERSRAS